MTQVEREEAYAFDPTTRVVEEEHFDELLDTLEDLLARWEDGKIELSADEFSQLKDYVEALKADDDD